MQEKDVTGRSVFGWVHPCCRREAQPCVFQAERGADRRVTEMCRSHYAGPFPPTVKFKIDEDVVDSWTPGCPAGKDLGPSPGAAGRQDQRPHRGCG